MPDLFDVVELIVDIPEHGLRAGMQGTIVDCHSKDAYEVEFTNEHGETVEFLALRPTQFILLRESETPAELLLKGSAGASPSPGMGNFKPESVIKL